MREPRNTAAKIPLLASNGTPAPTQPAVVAGATTNASRSLVAATPLPVAMPTALVIPIGPALVGSASSKPSAINGPLGMTMFDTR